MKTKVAKFTTRAAARYPHAAVEVGEFAARRWKGAGGTTRAIRSTTEVVRSGASGVKVAAARASDPAVQHELKASLEAFASALKRTRKVGLRRATDDRRLTKDVNQALEHASKAVSIFQGRKKTHRLRWAGVVIVSALLAGGYAESMRRRSNDWARSRPA
jgi:hypothetical protein